MEAMSMSKWHAVFGHTTGVACWVHHNGRDEHFRSPASLHCCCSETALSQLSSLSGCITLAQFLLVAGVHNMMYAHQTYVPAPIQQSAPILSVERTTTTAHSLEQTVPLLHEAHTAKDVLVGAYKTAHHQVASALLLVLYVDNRLVTMHPPEWLSKGAATPHHHTSCLLCS